MSTATTHPPRRPAVSDYTVRRMVGQCQRGVGMATVIDNDLASLGLVLDQADAGIHSAALAKVGRIAMLWRQVADSVRWLFRDQLAADCPACTDTPAVAPSPSTPLSRPQHTAGPITVVESTGAHPVYYLLGPSNPLFAGMPFNGAVLATVAQSNPNGRADAALWSKAGDLRELLAELVDCHTRGSRVGECSTVARAVQLLSELDEGGAG